LKEAFYNKKEGQIFC